MPRTAAARSPVASLTWEQAAAFRVRRHHPDARVPRSRMLDVVSLGGSLDLRWGG